MAQNFQQMLDRDAALVFGGGPATGFGTTVKNGSTTFTGLVDDRYLTVSEGGFEAQRRVKVLRVAAGEGGTIEVNTELVIGGVRYRVDDVRPVEPDLRFVDYVLAGGAA